MKAASIAFTLAVALVFQVSATVGVTPCGTLEAYIVPDGRDYRGHRNTTISGLTCQRWDVQTPHRHTTKQDGFRGIGEHNYCRNADHGDHPGCYTTDPKVRYEYCDVGATCSDNVPNSKVDPVSASPAPSTKPFLAPLQISLTTSTPEAVIRFTTDGSIPNANSQIYTAPITLDGDGTIVVTAIAMKSPLLPSDPVSLSFLLRYPTLDTVSILPDSSVIGNRPVFVSMKAPPEAHSIRYTLDGSVPDENDLLYSSPFWVKTDTTIIASAFAPKYRPSPPTVRRYALNVPRAPSPTVKRTDLAFGEVRFDLSSSLSSPQYSVSINGTGRVFLSNPFMRLTTVGTTVLDFTVEDRDTSPSAPVQSTVTLQPFPVVHLSQVPGTYHQAITVTASTDPALPLVVTVNGKPVLPKFSLADPGTYQVVAYAKSDEGVVGPKREVVYVLTPRQLSKPTLSPGQSSGAIFTSPTFVNVLSTSDPNVVFMVSIDDSPPTRYTSNGAVIPFTSDAGKKTFSIKVRAVAFPSSAFDLDSETVEMQLTVDAPAAVASTYYRINVPTDTDTSPLQRRLSQLFATSNDHIEVRKVAERIFYFRFVQLSASTLTFYENWAFAQLQQLTSEAKIGVSSSGSLQGCTCLIQSTLRASSDQETCFQSCANDGYAVFADGCRCLSSSAFSSASIVPCDAICPASQKALPIVQVNSQVFGTKFGLQPFGLSWQLSTISDVSTTTSSSIVVDVTGRNLQGAIVAKFVSVGESCESLASTFPLAAKTTTLAQGDVVVRQAGTFELCVQLGSLGFERVPHVLGSRLTVSIGRTAPVDVYPPSGSYILDDGVPFVVSSKTTTGATLSVVVDGAAPIRSTSNTYNISLSSIGGHTVTVTAILSSGDVGAPTTVDYNLQRRVTSSPLSQLLPSATASYAVSSAGQFRLNIHTNTSQLFEVCGSNAENCQFWVASTTACARDGSTETTIDRFTPTVAVTNLISLRGTTSWNQEPMVACVSVSGGNALAVDWDKNMMFPLSPVSISEPCPTALREAACPGLGCALDSSKQSFSCICQSRTVATAAERGLRVNAQCAMNTQGEPNALSVATYVNGTIPTSPAPATNNVTVVTLKPSPDFSHLKGSWVSLAILGAIFGVSFLVLCYIKRPRTIPSQEELPSAPKQAYNWVVHGQLKDQTEKVDVYAMQTKEAKREEQEEV